MKNRLLAGTAEIDITPPVGTSLAGSLFPRTSEGVDDPLYVKAIVLELNGKRIAYVILDLIALSRVEGDKAVELAASKTGIPEGSIIWAASHTHTGPYTRPLIFGSEEGGINQEWFDTIPQKFAECIEKACSEMIPVTVSRMRGYHDGVSTNRRFKFKDGREINKWLLESGEEDVQCLGSAGPIDPEIGILSFENDKGELAAVMFHFTLHTNTNFGKNFSGDYPAVVADRIKEEFGEQAVTLFVPGACADINSPVKGYKNIGNSLADRIIDKLKQRKPYKGDISINAAKREITVPFRDLTKDQEERIQASQWPDPSKEVFRRELEKMREDGITEAATWLQAWRIGDTGFASLPGELFVEWGLKIKEESPFPWTFPVELGADYLGYLVTEQAWKAGGYESLIARSARPSWEGVELMVTEALYMLNELYEEC